MYDEVEIMKTLMILSKILDIPFSWKEEPEPEPKRLQAFWWRLHSPGFHATIGTKHLPKNNFGVLGRNYVFP